VGELLVRPPSTAIDLADDRVTTDGFVRTGDLARIDDADFVWIEGRAGDLINRGGNKVFPDEVEEVLRSVAGVDDVAVFAAPDERLGEVPVAAIVGDVDDEVLDATVRANLAPYKAPTVYHHVTALPRSEVGKVLRRRLAEELS
jgi:acyl-CoA synthetase (AMP-forming)/AMP-acid ligase II